MSQKMDDKKKSLSEYPSVEYYMYLGFSREQAEHIVAGFGVEDYPTRKEWIEQRKT